MLVRNLVICLKLLLQFYELRGSETKQEVYELENKLLDKYNRERPPVYSLPIHVRIHVKFVELLKIDIETQQVYLAIQVYQTWTDDFLQWNATEYIPKEMYFTHNQVWIPPLIIQNCKLFDIIRSNLTLIPLTVCSNGEVYLLHAMKVIASCKMLSTFFPWDYQYSEILIGPWTEDSTTINLTNTLLCEKSINYIKHHEWTLLAIETVQGEEIIYIPIENRNFTFQYFKYIFYFKRKPEFYEKIIIFPTFIISILTLLSFFLPSECNEKTVLLANLILAFIFTLVVTMKNLPKVSNFYPIIGYYYILSIVILCLALFNCVFVANFLKKSKKLSSPPPFITAFFERLLTFKSYKSCTPIRGNMFVEDSFCEFFSFYNRFAKQSEESTLNNEEIPNEEFKTSLANIYANLQIVKQKLIKDFHSRKIKLEWMYVADSMDRLAAIIFLFSSICAFIALKFCVPSELKYNDKLCNYAKLQKTDDF